MLNRIVRPLDRYVFGEFWKIFVVTALGFPILVIVIDLTDNLEKYLSKDVPRANIALSYLYWLPDSMFMILPAAVLFATYVVRPDLAGKHMQVMGGPSSVKGVMPGADAPIATQFTNWLQEGLQLYLPGDQALPQEIVAAYFEAQDSVILGAMTPAEAAKSVQSAITAFKARGQ